jgi:hypothetical protein
MLWTICANLGRTIATLHMLSVLLLDQDCSTALVQLVMKLPMPELRAPMLMNAHLMVELGHARILIQP